MKLIIFSLLLLSVASFGDEEFCFTGGRVLSIKTSPMTVTASPYKKTLVTERVLGSVDTKNFFDILGFFTYQEMRNKFCGRTVTDQPVIYYPSYQEVRGQNGFYWYLGSQASAPATHLLLVEGRIHDGHCEELLEGASSHFIRCN